MGRVAEKQIKIMQRNKKRKQNSIVQRRKKGKAEDVHCQKIVMHKQIFLQANNTLCMPSKSVK